MNEDSADWAAGLRAGSPGQDLRGQDSLRSQDQAAGMGWLLCLMLDEQVPIWELTRGSPFLPT